MEIRSFVESMPKVELHVHLEGSIRPETLLRLAERHGIALPADSLEGLREWYTFRDFRHFVEIYVKASSCLRTADDIELIAREFLKGQAEQNILYTEATYTALTILHQSGIPLDEQLAAINRARAWGSTEMGVEMGLVIDIVREETVEDGLMIADWVIANYGNGIAALGLSGVESDTHPRKHREAFARARAAGIPSTCHAGETAGPWSIRECLEDLGADRIGHGVRCLEDPALVRELTERGAMLEVCPSSNVCLGVFPSFAEHPLPRMMEADLNVSVNSDDPPMFNTTLTNELLRCAETFGFDPPTLTRLQRNAAQAAFLSPTEKQTLLRRLEEGSPEAKRLQAAVA